MRAQASVHVNWAHTKDDLRTRYNSRAHACARPSPTPPPRLPKAHTNSERANERALSHANAHTHATDAAPAQVWEKHEVEAAGFVWRGNATAKSSHDELHKKIKDDDLPDAFTWGGVTASTI